MALIARLRETRRNVVRVRRRLVILHMTTHTGGRRQVETIVEVAVGALARRHRMSAGQRKSRSRVIEMCVQPGIGSVTGRASCREPACHVIGIRSCLKIFEVARRTHRRRRLESAGGFAFVAGIAVHDGVRSRQREAIIMLLDLAHRNLPPLDGMALLAIGS